MSEHPWSDIAGFSQEAYVALALLERVDALGMSRPKAVHAVAAVHPEWTFGKTDRVYRKLSQWGCFRLQNTLTDTGHQCMADIRRKIEEVNRATG